MRKNNLICMIPSLALLLVGLSFGLYGCGGDKNPTTDATPTPKPTTTPTPTFTPSPTPTPDTRLGSVTLDALGDLPGKSFFSAAYAVSPGTDAGQFPDGPVVVGQSESDRGKEAFIWTRFNGMQRLTNLGGSELGLPTPQRDFSSVAYGVTDDRSVVGTITAYIGSAGTERREGFLWTPVNGNGIAQLIRNTNDGTRVWAYGLAGEGAGAIVGFALFPETDTSVNRFEAYRWFSSTNFVGESIGDLPGGDFFSEGHSISADGNKIVGRSISGAAQVEAFFWEQGRGLQALGFLPGGDRNSIAIAISPKGNVVAGRSSSAKSVAEGSFEAFYWTPTATTLTPLGDLAGGAFSSESVAVSNDFVILGVSSSTLSGPNRDEIFLWNPNTPEKGGGMISLKDHLTRRGFDTTGWEFTVPKRETNSDHLPLSISLDGKIIVGAALHNGNTEAFLLTSEKGFRIQP
jgi:uncharacterized membrane protein